MNKKGAVPSAMIPVGIFCIIFALAFPLYMQMVNSSNYTFISDKEYNSVKTKNVFGLKDSVSIYFKYMFLDIPEINPILKGFVVFVDMMAALFVIMLFLDILTSVIGKLVP